MSSRGHARMGRLRGYEFVLGFLVATALWAILFAVYPQYDSAQSQPQHTANAEPNEIAAAKSVDDRLATYTLWLVIFTAVLAGSTICLWIVTWRAGVRQSRDMKASVAVAADAAHLGAQASISVQLPRLTARSMKLFEPSQPYGAYRPFGTLIGSGDPREWSQVSVQICNIGKKNAVLTEECIDFFVGPRLPTTPKYTVVLPSPVDHVIEADGYMDLQITNYFIHLTTEQRSALRNIELSHRLWVYGFIRYTDFLGNQHEYRFCRRCTWKGGIGGLVDFVSEINTPAEYTRSLRVGT